jgi:hypothetical protein
VFVVWGPLKAFGSFFVDIIKNPFKYLRIRVIKRVSELRRAGTKIYLTTYAEG